jgi:hypothetical protein
LVAALTFSGSLLGASNSLFSRINSLFGLKISLFLRAGNIRLSARTCGLKIP